MFSHCSLAFLAASGATVDTTAAEGESEDMELCNMYFHLERKYLTCMQFKASFFDSSILECIHGILALHTVLFHFMVQLAIHKKGHMQTIMCKFKRAESP